MADLRLLAGAAIGLIFGGSVFFKGFSWQKQKKIIEDLPTSKVRSIAMGLVELFGKASVASTKLRSPFSGKDCVYYRYRIEEYKKRGKHSKWVVIDRGVTMDYFYLEDETGKVLIDPKEAEIDIPLDFEFSSSLGRDPPEEIKNFLKNKGMSFEGFLGMNKSMRYREYFIEPGDKLYVLGTAGDNPFVKEGSSQKNEADIMIQKGKSFYYISDKGEREVLKKFKWRVIGGLYGGAALILACLAIAFSQLGIL